MRNDVSMLRVKVSISGAGSVPSLSQFVGNDQNRIEGCRFFVNEPLDEADVWFVSEDVEAWDTECRVPPSRTAFITSETSWEPGHYAEGTSPGAFIQQFSRIFTCHDVFCDGVDSQPPFLPWMINANHGRSMLAPHARDVDALRSLTALEKSRTVSVFCSAQTLTPLHRMRLRFVEGIKAHFGDDLDWYGNGINPLAEKWDGIAPYRYTIVLENQSTENVFTEKIYDAYLGLAYPIYWGAPNLGDYFDPQSFTPINIRDLGGSIRQIEQVIGSDLAELRQPELLSSRDRVVNEYNMFARLARIARELVAGTEGEPSQLVRIEPHAHFVPVPANDPVSSLGRLLTRAGGRLSRRGLS